VKSSNPHPLAGRCIVVTRPAHQAQRLTELIEAQGGTVLLFPVLEILDPQDRGPLLSSIDRLETFDLAVFISPNAVHKAMNLIMARRGGLPLGLKLATVGRGSARELERYGRRADIYPTRKFNSEALLATAELQDMTGKRVVIFRGEGGRELLGNTLRERGADVEYAEAYRRRVPNADVNALMRRWVRGEIDIITVTSNDSLRNLFDLVGKIGQQWLRHTPLAVYSDRTVSLAQELGFKTTPVVAAEASDEALVQALIAWSRRRMRPN
jgi:uroporphyrinogen-III synthase